MKAKNTGLIVATIFFITFFAIIGSSFMAYVYAEKKITINNPAVIVADGITCTNKDGEAITSLKLSKSVLGLKPATGELDDETEIPTTVTSSSGSEGLYSVFKIISSVAWSMFVTDIVIESENDVTEDLENVKIGLKDKTGSVVDLTKPKALIASGEATTEPIEHTLFVWLHASAGDPLVGAKITFNISIEKTP